MRCIVLGGGGFIGANLCHRLITDGHEVTAVDIAFPEWRTPPPGVECVTVDLTDWARVERVLKWGSWVFHLAADMGGVGYFHSDADLGAALRNGLITNNVLTVLQPHQRLFYASSVCCYPIEARGGNPPRKLGEEWIGFGTPDALYGADKLHGLRLCSKIPNARVGVLDTTYGPLQEHEGRRMKFPAAVATKALAARHTGVLELWGDGQQRRAYQYIDDTVEKIMRVMRADHYSGPVNIGASGTVTCHDVARMCLDIAGVPEAEIVTNPNEPTGVPTRDNDNSKFEQNYGRVDETPLREGFEKFMSWLDRPEQAKTTTRTPPRNAMRPPPAVR